MKMFFDFGGPNNMLKKKKDKNIKGVRRTREGLCCGASAVIWGYRNILALVTSSLCIAFKRR